MRLQATTPLLAPRAVGHRHVSSPSAHRVPTTLTCAFSRISCTTNLTGNLQLGKPDLVFTESQVFPMAIRQLMFSQLLEASEIDNQIHAATIVEQFDTILLKAIEQLELVLPPTDTGLTKVMLWRANLLHQCGLTILSSRSTSGWGRRMLAHGHIASVDAMRATAEPSGSLCRRRIQWGWADEPSILRKDASLVRFERIAVPSGVTRLSEVGDNRHGPIVAAYSTTPDNHPGFVSSTLYAGGVPPRQSRFTDAGNAYAIEWKDVFLEGNDLGAL
jgi:hypothetical protein